MQIKTFRGEYVDWKDASLFERYGTILVFSILGAGFAYFFIYGKEEQVRYLDATPAVTFTDGTLLLATYPRGSWLSQPNAMFKTLEKGCVYRFRHFTMCGRRGCNRNTLKYVRGIEYVHCSPPPYEEGREHQRNLDEHLKNKKIHDMRLVFSDVSDLRRNEIDGRGGEYRRY